ncbi:hypothetical protein ACOI1C_08350 [Bacillus sp. DJP31]|uniref:hypothetical protein n=1 Tax=Bacillus sp. DJP31 TaxID=3409789 RepID=UPI003BB710CA
MILLNWSYTKRCTIKANFDYCPNSTVIFRPIRDYYFVYTINWSNTDSVVTRDELSKMEQLVNEELGTKHQYYNRKSISKNPALLT